MRKTTSHLLAALLLTPALLFLNGEARADQFKDTGEYVIYFNAVQTSLLPPAVARAYGITRSDARVMLNVTVHRKMDEGPDKPVRSEISAQAVNLSGQLKRFSMKELIDEEAIYYIGEVSVGDGETLDFDIRVTPEGEKEAHRVQFRRQYHRG
jgi:hypothetical protein